MATVQDETLRAGLQHYTLAGGAGPLLDAAQDSLRESPFVVFEMETLLSRGAKDLIPVLLYLFHRIDQRCQSGVPTLIVIDEAWLLLARDRFGQKLEEWLRTLPKKNAAVMLATQSLADIERSPYRSVIVESCQTKIFLPNAEARTEQSAALYHALGLNERQIEVLSYATPKKHYFYSSPLGRRLFDMHVGPVARAFVGAGGREDIARAKTLHRAVWRRVAVSLAAGRMAVTRKRSGGGSGGHDSRTTLTKGGNSMQPCLRTLPHDDRSAHRAE